MPRARVAVPCWNQDLASYIIRLEEALAERWRGGSILAQPKTAVPSSLLRQSRLSVALWTGNRLPPNQFPVTRSTWSNQAQAGEAGLLQRSKQHSFAWIRRPEERIGLKFNRHHHRLHASCCQAILSRRGLRLTFHREYSKGTALVCMCGAFLFFRFHDTR